MRFLLVLFFSISSYYLNGQCLSSSQPIPMGQYPNGIVTDLLDGDSWKDIATVNRIDNTVSVAFSNGNGTFQSSVPYPVGTDPVSITTGLMNFDMLMDIVVTNSQDSSVTILFNSGGTFSSSVTIPAGIDPQSVTVGDFNGDQIRDLAVANYLSNNVAIIMGLGSQTYSAPSFLTAGTGPVFVKAVKLVGDNFTDLIVANYFGNSISILYGLGNGSFNSPTTLNTGLNPTWISEGLMNGDSYSDLVACNEGSDDITMFLSTGPTTFGPPVTIPTGQQPSCIVFSEINGDNFYDLITATGNSGGITFHMGFGNGQFGGPSAYSTNVGAGYLVPNDFNSDSKPDLAVVGILNINAEIVFNGGNGLFGGAVSTPVTPSTICFAEIADMNNDSFADFILPTTLANDDSVRVYIGNGDGSFQPHLAYPAFSITYDAAVGNFNSDQIPDVVTARFGGLSFFPGIGNGALGTRVDYTANNADRMIKIADFNGDQNLDVILCQPFSMFPAQIFFGNGNGSFSGPVNETNHQDFALFDFDNDGDIDVAELYGNTIIKSINNGSGVFTSQFQTIPNYAGMDKFSCGDFNNDGRMDLQSLYGDSIVTLLGGASFTFSNPISSYSFNGFTSMDHRFLNGDFDGDGNVDLLTLNTSTGNFYYHKGLGNGRFNVPIQYISGHLPREFLAGEFDNNYSLDLITYESNQIKVHLNCGSFPPTPPPSGSPDETSSVINLKTYPNPASNFVIIESPSFEIYGSKLSCLIHTVLGQTVSVPYEINDNKVVFETSSLRDGLYLFTIQSKDGKNGIIQFSEIVCVIH